MRHACFIFIFLASAGTAHAGPVKCNEEGTQAEINICADEDYAKADQRLNAEYQKKMSALHPPRQEELRAQQRNWVNQSKPLCTAVADNVAKGGSMWTMIFTRCFEDRADQRTEEIQEFH